MVDEGFRARVWGLAHHDADNDSRRHSAAVLEINEQHAAISALPAAGAVNVGANTARKRKKHNKFHNKCMNVARRKQQHATAKRIRCCNAPLRTVAASVGDAASVAAAWVLGPPWALKAAFLSAPARLALAGSLDGG